MNRNRLASGTAVFVLLVGGTLALGGSARAATCTAYPCDLTDDYQGGIVTYSLQGSTDGNPADTIENSGTHNFEVRSVSISRPDANNLSIKVITNFATITTANADGTTYGSVFFGSPPITQTYQPGQWTRAFVLNSAIAGTTTSGTGQLYNIGATNPTPLTSVGGVAQTYQTANGTIIMSNVGGNPVTAGAGNPAQAPFYFRQGQAVQYAPNDPNANKVGSGVSWSVSNNGTTVGPNAANDDYLLFTINDGGALGNDFVLAWAMTCANDVFQGYVSIPSQQTPPPVPLPGALALMGTVLAGAGGIAKWRKGRKAA